MRYRRFFAMALACVLAMVTLGACTKPQEKDGTKIYATIAPVYDFTKKIAGDRQQVELIVSSDVHDYEPSAADMARFQDTPMIIKNGMGLDSFADKISTQRMVDTSVGAEKEAYEMEEGHGADDGHDHGDEMFDPHIWLYPLNAKKQMENIKIALSEYDPENADYYEQNYQAMAQKCDELDGKLKALSGKSVVTTHAAYTYLERKYGLECFPMDVGGENEISPARMKDVVEHCKAKGISKIYMELGSSDKNAQAVAQEIGGQVASLNSYESNVADNNDYFAIMEANYQALTNE